MISGDDPGLEDTVQGREKGLSVLLAKLAHSPPRTPGPDRPQVEKPDAAPGSLGETRLVQTRLALFGKTMALVAIGFFVVVNFVVWLVLGRGPIAPIFAQQRSVMHLAGAAVMALLWLVCRRGSRSRRLLGALDVACLMVACACWALMVDERSMSAGVGPPLLANTITVIARAVLIPSRARRTLWLSLAAMAPTLLAQLLFISRPAASFRAVYATSTAAWIAGAVATATVVSHVIYGLRRQVEEARELGQYTLERLLGRGGMGEVWRARHRLLIRPAAIKVIRPLPLGATGPDPELLSRRFEREARATAALRSPHTVQLYDFGVADDGRLYYVMELLDGMDLQHLVDLSGPMPAERAIHVLEQVCHSLAEAHDNGLIHCDVKPANIFLDRVGDDPDFVKVLDFGLVKLSQVEGGAALALADGETAGGTPSYMAPEIVLGRADHDRRADLYSLGCVAYWLVCGEVVFDGGPAKQVMRDHAHTAPVPPSRRRDIALPRAFEQIIMECLEKDPARRPSSAAAIAARLRACEVAQPWTAERAQKWWRDHVADSERRRVPVAEQVGIRELRTLRPLRRPELPIG